MPMMVVSGLNDATDVNFLGTHAWLQLLPGASADAYRATPRTRWKVKGEVLGYLQSGGGLTSVDVRNAGHLTALDQPRLIDLMLSTLAASGASDAAQAGGGA